MMKSEKFLATVNSVLTNSLHAPIIERFQKFADDIEILDGVMYQLSSDHALYVSKEIFSRLFAWTQLTDNILLLHLLIN